MYTNALILLIKVCQLIRNFVCDVTNHNKFGSVLTAVNEARKYIYLIFDHMYFHIPMVFQYNAAHNSLMQPPYYKAVSGTPPRL